MELARPASILITICNVKIPNNAQLDARNPNVLIDITSPPHMLVDLLELIIQINSLNKKVPSRTLCSKKTITMTLVTLHIHDALHR